MIDRRTVLAGAIISPLLSMSAAAQVPTGLAIGFAPPLNIDLFSVTRTSVAAGSVGVVTLSVTRRYRFARNGRGYTLTSEIADMSDDAPPELSHRLRANLTPLSGMQLGFLLTDHGALFALSDETSAMLALQNSVATTVDGGPSSPMLQSIAAMTPEQQHALLFNEARDLTRFAGQQVQNAVLMNDMAVIEQPESENSPLRLRARVHAVSGLSWLIDRTADPAHIPHHGVVATRMELRA